MAWWRNGKRWHGGGMERDGMVEEWNEMAWWRNGKIWQRMVGKWNEMA